MLEIIEKNCEANSERERESLFIAFILRICQSLLLGSTGVAPQHPLILHVLHRFGKHLFALEGSCVK